MNNPMQVIASLECAEFPLPQPERWQFHMLKQIQDITEVTGVFFPVFFAVMNTGMLRAMPMSRAHDFGLKHGENVVEFMRDCLRSLVNAMDPEEYMYVQEGAMVHVEKGSREYDALTSGRLSPEDFPNSEMLVAIYGNRTKEQQYVMPYKKVNGVYTFDEKVAIRDMEEDAIANNIAGLRAHTTRFSAQKLLTPDPSAPSLS
jgi:hypothetical protein